MRRLRQPQYLLAFVLGIAYFSLVLLGGRRTPDDRPRMRDVFPSGDADGGIDFGFAVLMFASAALAWIWPRAGRPALPFSRAEVQHLFTAPIPRSELIRYRALRSQLGAVFGSAIITLVFRPTSLAEGAMAFVGLLVLMTTINLHLTGVSLSRAASGLGGWLPRVVAGAAVIVVAATVAMNWPQITEAAGQRPLRAVTEIDRLTSGGAAAVVLWPFRALARLPLAKMPQEFMAALPWGLGLLLLNYFWVVRSNASFEEASAELSEKLEELRRRGPRALHRPPTGVRKRTPFRLAPEGRPEAAIAWKNLISMGRVLSWTVLLRVAPILIFFAVAFSQGRSDRASFLTFMCLLIAVLTLFAGPQFVRGDLRQDLTALAVLKTWPIRGAALVRGEILAPAIVLTTVICLALISAAVLAPATLGADGVASRWSWLLAALFVAPGLVVAQLLIQNGLAVVFPAWVRLGHRPGGVDAIGQQMLVVIVVVLALFVTLLPAALVAGIGAAIFYLLTGTVSVILPGALAGTALLVEAFAGSELIGAVLDRSDIGAIDPSEGGMT
jgi:hypothetical protein